MRFAHPEYIATWPSPNLVNPELRGPELYIINSIFAFAASTAVILRLYVRVFVRRWVGLDDYLLAFAWLCGLGDLATVFYGTAHVSQLIYSPLQSSVCLMIKCGQFNPIISINGTDISGMQSISRISFTAGAKAVYSAKIFWLTASSFIRFSLLASYYRLVAHVDALHRGTYRWVLHAATLYNIAVFLSYLGVTVFDCADPAQYFQWPGTGYCINELYANVSLSAFNTFAEALLAALPIPVIMSLHMSEVQQRTVLALLCLGFVVSIIGTVRTYYVWKLFDTDDLTWYTSPHWICSEVEICTAMICACAPALRSLAGRYLWREQMAVANQRPERLKKKRTSAGSTESSRQISSVEEGWTPPTQYQYDLEGIGLDGFGYTVTITGPRPRRRRLANCFQGSPATSNETLEAPSRWRNGASGNKPEVGMESDEVELHDKKRADAGGMHDSTSHVS